MRLIKVTISVGNDILSVQGTENYIGFSASDLFDYQLKNAIEKCGETKFTGQSDYAFQVNVVVYGELKSV